MPGLEFSRMEIDPGGRMVGIPHTSGTREYLTCEYGRIELIIAGEHWLLDTGDRRHTYRNPDTSKKTIAVSVVCFAG